MSKTSEETAPAWVEELKAKYASGVSHAFLLHGAIDDYAVPGVRMSHYLSKLWSKRSIVCFYNRADGIRFALPSMREQFMSLLGLDQQAADPGLAALASVTGINDQDQDLPKSPSAALPLLIRLLKMGSGDDNLAACIIEQAQTIIPDASLAMMSPEDRTLLVLLQQLGRDPEIEASGNPIILLAPDLTELHPAIRAASSKYEAIHVPLPDREIRLSAVNKYMEKYGEIKYEMTAEQIAGMTAGLSLIHLEDLFLRSAAEGTLSQKLVRERKQDIIASEFEVLESIEPRFGFEMIGGLDAVKSSFKRWIIDPVRAGKSKLVPMGVLLVGPPGTGKTAIAEAVAFEAGFNCVNLNLARIFGKWVGESEKSMERALNGILSMQPVLVLIDEADQTISRSSGDGGVSGRIFRRLLTFMGESEHRGKVVFLACTNRPDLMDAALRRPGRFDKSVPLLLPEPEERRAILEVMGRKYGLEMTEVPDEAVLKTEGWTGAELEMTTVKALELVEYDGKDPDEAIVLAVRSIRPSTADLAFMTALALRETNDKDLLPKKYWAMWQDRDALAKRISESTPAARGKRESF